MRSLKRTAIGSIVLWIAATGVVVAMPWSRDLDDQPSIKPQERPIPPPEFSVPIDGREFAQAREIEQKLVNPVAADSASRARGQKLFETYCFPCHGMKGEGLGNVVKKGFSPPPALTGSHARGLSDGYIYSYIRHGGAIMPPYGFALRPQDAWTVINYVRQLQRENPTP